MTASPLRVRRVVGSRGAPIVLLGAYLVAMFLLLASAVIDFRNSRALEQSSAKVARTIEALEKLRTIGNAFSVAESSQRGYLLTGDAAYLEPFRDMQQRLQIRLSEVGAVLSDTPTERAALVRLRDLAAIKFSEMDRTVNAYGTNGQAAAVSLFSEDESAQTMAAARDLIRAMLAEETQVLGEHRRAAARAYSSGLAKTFVATAVVGLALTVFYVLMRRFLRQRDAALRTVEATNAELEQRVIDRTADLSLLSRHLLNVREHEKKAIARDLHDDFGSYLTAINMDVSRVRDKICATNPEQAAKLERTLGLLNSAIDMKRQLISDLRPSMLDNLGLGAALEQYIEEWARRNGIQASFDQHGELSCNDDGCPIAIFRVFQEALTNIAKHARATRVAAYAYRTGDEIEFEIADDGIGIADADRAKPGAHGLLGIRERVLAYGGRCEIVAGPKRGTIVRGTMPCVVPSEDRTTTPAAHPA
jgi:signal transduction histidine kinase